MNIQSTVSQKYSWLAEPNLNVVVGDDLDSIISAIFMHHILGWNVVGYYVGYTTLLLGQNFNLNDVVFLDLDICYPYSRSIGHHIINNGTLPASHPSLVNSVNPNEIRGIGLNSFKRKYPLATIHFLFWLYQHACQFSFDQRMLLWTPDSAWINAQGHRFQQNVRDWVQYLNLHFMDQDIVGASPFIDDIVFENKIKQVFQVFTNTGFKTSGQIDSKNLNLKGFQCQYDPRTDLPKVNALSSHISSIMNWKQYIFPGRQNMQVLQGKRGGKNPNIKLDAWIKSTPNLFSYAMDYRTHLNYTIL